MNVLTAADPSKRNVSKQEIWPLAIEVSSWKIRKRNRSRILGFLPIESLVGDFENE